MRNLANFHQNALSVKISTFVGSFCSKQRIHELKIYRGAMLMTLKNDDKFEEKLPCQFKIGMRKLKNFDQSTQKSQKTAV